MKQKVKSFKEKIIRENNMKCSAHQERHPAPYEEVWGEGRGRGRGYLRLNSLPASENTTATCVNNDCILPCKLGPAGTYRALHI